MIPLKNLSNYELAVKLEGLVKHERATSAEILLHLIEVEKREMHIHEGYSSLFSYCTRKLSYSEPAAMRRISSARAVAAFPEIYAHLVSGEVSLTTLSLIASELTDESKENLLAEVKGKSRSEVEAILARRRPQTKTVERVREVVVAPFRAREEKRSMVPAGDLLFATQPEVKREAAPATVPSAPQATPPEKRYALSFSVDENTYRQIEEAKVLLAAKHPDGVSLEAVMAAVVGEYLERHSPEKRYERREKQQARKDSPSPEKAVEGSKDESREAPARTRHIPSAIRDRVFTRDGGRCTYVGPDGVRCGSRYLLQLDHKVPFAREGGHDPENLHVVCAVHNQHLAKLHFGREHMAKFTRK